MKEVADGRNLPDQPYPIALAQRVCHPPQHRRHSSRRRLGRRPVAVDVSNVRRYGVREGVGRVLCALSEVMTRCSGTGEAKRMEDEPLGRYPWRRHCEAVSITAAGACVGVWTHMRRQVFPQAPSPTMTNLRRISAICATGQQEPAGFQCGCDEVRRWRDGGGW